MEPINKYCHTCGELFCTLPEHNSPNLSLADAVEIWGSHGNRSLSISAGYRAQQIRGINSPPTTPTTSAHRPDGRMESSPPTPSRPSRGHHTEVMRTISEEAERNFGGGSRRPGDSSQQRGTSPMGASQATQEVVDDKIYWEQEKFAKLGVKGNFLPLAAQPRHVGLADWLGHKCSEEYRVLEALIKILQERNAKNHNMTICNPQCCPSMSAGKNYTYTWLNSQKEPVKVPAIQYISLVQRWIVGKLSDPRVFPCEPLSGTAATYASGGLDTTHANTPIPAGPTSLSSPLSELSGRNWVGKDQNFPENFVTDVKTIFRQMFRIYAHIYHSHWVNPFWHLSGSSDKATGYTDLNSAFCNFIIVAKLFVLLSEKDIEPMQRLIDIWTGNGLIPQEALRGDCDVNKMQAQLKAGGSAGPPASTAGTVPAAPPASA